MREVLGVTEMRVTIYEKNQSGDREGLIYATPPRQDHEELEEPRTLTEV
jgi:hypothetical protein